MKIYLIVPLLSLAAFTGYEWHTSAALRREAADRQARLDTAHAAKLQTERIAQEQALAAALAEQEKQKQTRAAKAARDRAAQESRQAALDTLAATRQRSTDLTRQVERLQQEIAIEKKSLAELESEKLDDLSEQAFLRDLAVKTDANLKSLTALLEKIAAESARANAPSRNPTP
ncbi:MAG: hypothetical protein WCL04_08270 [Verrucomicrobiota bacterium]